MQKRKYNTSKRFFDKICGNCSKEYKAKVSTSKFCEKKCREEYKLKEKSENLKKDGKEGEDYIICEWCKLAVKTIIPSHIKNHPGKNLNDYKEEFPNAPLTCSSSLYGIIKGAKKAGNRMKEDKYRKLISERVKGDKNPMSSKNKSELERKQASKFSIEYWKKNFPELSEEEINDKISEFVKESLKNRLSPTQIKYWTERGHSAKEAKKIISERQKTFSKEICIKKHGKEKGINIWKERQRKWIKTMDDKPHEEKMEILKKKIFSDGKYSKISQKLFWKIYSILENKKDIFFKELNDEFFINIKDENFFVVDFKYKNKIIEFQGDFWHMNPKIYESEEINSIRKISASEIWETDLKKKTILEKNNYNILFIWEQDFKNNPQETIKKCLEFLNA